MVANEKSQFFSCIRMQPEERNRIFTPSSAFSSRSLKISVIKKMSNENQIMIQIRSWSTCQQRSCPYFPERNITVAQKTIHCMKRLRSIRKKYKSTKDYRYKRRENFRMHSMFFFIECYRIATWKEEKKCVNKNK